jgi:Cu2+-exporting ATPase
MPAGHDKHAGHSVEMFRRKFRGTLLLSLPTIAWAPTIQHWFGYQAPGGAPASRWVPAVFGTLVFAYGGWVFIKGAIGEIRDRLPGMMTLISLAISVAFLFSLAVTLVSRDPSSGGSWPRWSRSRCSATGSKCDRFLRRKAP